MYKLIYMFLELSHTKLDVYSFSKKLCLKTYAATKSFPADEKYILTHQIKRAALSVHLNIAEGSSRKSETERKRFYEIARGSLIEIDAAFDIAEVFGYCSQENLSEFGEIMLRTFKMISGLINSTTK